MSTLEIVVALLRGAHMAALVSLFGTLVFLTLVAPAAVAEAAKDAPRLRRRLLRVARISAALALIVGIAWIAAESAVIASADSVAMTLQALPVVALRTQFGADHARWTDGFRRGWRRHDPGGRWHGRQRRGCNRDRRTRPTGAAEHEGHVAAPSDPVSFRRPASGPIHITPPPAARPVLSQH
jgi:hypothetical protein